MAGQSTITNPLGANRSQDTADWRTGKSDFGESLMPSRRQTFLAKGTIPPGSVVCFIAPSSATDKPGVVVKATARLLPSVVGVSDNVSSVASGAYVDVVVEGLAFVTVGAGTAAANSTAMVQTNSNEAAVIATEADATTIAGSVLGVYLGAKNATSLRAPVWVNLR